MLVDLDAVDKSLGQVFEEVGRNGEEFLRLCLDYVEREAKMVSKEGNVVREVVEKAIGEYEQGGSAAQVPAEEQQGEGGEGMVSGSEETRVMVLGASGC